MPASQSSGYSRWPVMSAQAGTSSPKPNLLSVRSPWLFGRLTKGHVCHVGVNKRPLIPTCFVSVTLSGIACSLVCLSGPVSNQLNQQQRFGTGARVTTRELWRCLLSFTALSAPRFVNGRTLAGRPSIGKQPTGTRPLAGYFCLKRSGWTALIRTRCHRDWITS